VTVNFSKKFLFT